MQVLSVNIWENLEGEVTTNIKKYLSFHLVLYFAGIFETSDSQERQVTH